LSPGKLFLTTLGFIPANPFLSFLSTPRKLFLGDPFGAAPVKLFEQEGETTGMGLAPVKLFSSSSGFVPGKLLFDSESDARCERVEPESEGRWEPAREGRREGEAEGGREEKGVETAEDSVEGEREVPREEVGVFLALEDLRDLGFFSKSLENMVAGVSGDDAEWLVFVMVVDVMVGITESVETLWSLVFWERKFSSVRYQ
jgi:hypothetical protein